ncbi:hypothetical protein TrispH2_011041 [Trichoplax sp. H2]|nr:hypothetical protein TrispH2_011041 [Trichoplax sp. H2]|eukprot:RDD37837.1 hypothetical protein TrispH2_011041 [Trichoplax sp. H2]
MNDKSSEHSFIPTVPNFMQIHTNESYQQDDHHLTESTSKKFTEPISVDSINCQDTDQSQIKKCYTSANEFIKYQNGSQATRVRNNGCQIEDNNTDDASNNFHEIAKSIYQNRADHSPILDYCTEKESDLELILADCDIHEIISDILPDYWTDIDVFNELTKYIRNELVISVQEQLVSLKSLTQQRDEIYVLILLRCIGQLQFYKLVSTLIASSLEKVKAIGYQLQRRAVLRLNERYEVVTKYPNVKFLCKADKDNIIKMDTLSGFELIIPAKCLQTDTEIMVTVYYADSLYAYGIKNINVTLLSPIIRIEPNNLQFIINDKYPTLQLPVLQSMQLKPTNLPKSEQKNSIQLYHGTSLYIEWSAKNLKNALINIEEDHNLFKINHCGFFCAVINQPKPLFDESAVSSQPFVDLTLQQQIDFQVFLSITTKGTAFVDIVITRKGIKYQPNRLKTIKLHELVNDMEDVTRLRNGYYQIKFLSSYLIHNSVDSRDKIKDICINWNARNSYVISYRCQLSDTVNFPGDLCQIIVQSKGINCRPIEALSSFIFLPDGLDEKDLQKFLATETD